MPLYCISNFNIANFSAFYYLTENQNEAIYNSLNLTERIYKHQIILQFSAIKHEDNFSERSHFNLKVTLSNQSYVLPKPNNLTRESILCLYNKSITFISLPRNIKPIPNRL